MEKQTIPYFRFLVSFALIGRQHGDGISIEFLFLFIRHHLIEERIGEEETTWMMMQISSRMKRRHGMEIFQREEKWILFSILISFQPSVGRSLQQKRKLVRLTVCTLNNAFLMPTFYIQLTFRCVLRVMNAMILKEFPEDSSFHSNANIFSDFTTSFMSTARDVGWFIWRA